MTEQLISFETAKLAKEKGFKIPTPVMYNGNEKRSGLNINIKYITYDF